MSRTMRAAVALGLDQPLVVREVPIREPGPGQVLVKLAASGVCHTDLHMLSSEWPAKSPHFPLVPGHEGSGHVAAVGQGVRDLKEGEPVGVFWLNDACGWCEFCASGHENVCPKQRGTGYNVDGTYAEYCLVSAGYAVPIPSNEPLLSAPILCAGVTSYKAIKKLGLNVGVVVVVGVGGTGHLAIQYARALGLDVVAVDVEPEKLELATKLGARFVVNARNVSPVNRVLNHTGGGAHGVVVTAGTSASFDQGARMLRRRGVCVLIGVANQPMQLSVSDAILRELTLCGSVAGTRQDLREALSFVSDGRVKPQIEVVPLEQVNVAMERLRDRRVNGRIVLDMTA